MYECILSGELLFKSSTLYRDSILHLFEGGGPHTNQDGTLNKLGLAWILPLRMPDVSLDWQVDILLTKSDMSHSGPLPKW